MIKRRTLLNLSVAAAVGWPMAMSLPQAPAVAQTEAVKVAVIAPMSGPWARQGELMLMGARLAAEDINAQGGIEALGGAKIEIVVHDAGDTAEKAKNAAQRMVSQETGLVGATGAWLSSFTLGVTEVTERAGLPLLTLSYSDQITDRGFQFVFQTSPTGGAQSEGALPALLDLAEQTTGERPDTIGIISDNTAAPLSFVRPLREGDLATKLGVEIVVDQTFTPPLPDATSLVQQVRSRRPDVLLFTATAIPDDKLVLEKLNEFGLGQGRLPVISNGAHIGAPELLTTVGADLLEGVMTVVANWGASGQEEIIERFKEETGEPWITQDSMSTYGDLWIFKEAMEAAGSADPKAVAQAIREMDTTEGPAKYFPGGRIRFDEKGRRVDAALVIVQWQSGEPVTVYPPESAMADPIWPTN